MGMKFYTRFTAFTLLGSTLCSASADEELFSSLQHSIRLRLAIAKATTEIIHDWPILKPVTGTEELDEDLVISMPGTERDEVISQLFHDAKTGIEQGSYTCTRDFFAKHFNKKSSCVNGQQLIRSAFASIFLAASKLPKWPTRGDIVLLKHDGKDARGKVVEITEPEKLGKCLVDLDFRTKQEDPCAQGRVLKERKDLTVISHGETTVRRRLSDNMLWLLN